MSNTTTEPAEAAADAGPGLFIAFEGVEGAGKSTQIERVADRLRSLDVPHRLLREPGSTPVGERIRDVLLDSRLEMSGETELLLVLAARAEFVRRVLRPALAAGELVLSDRYELSTFAYQGAGRGLGIEHVREWNRRATGGLAADLTILLLVASELGRGRQSGEPDRMEKEQGEFHQRVAGAYERLAAADETVVTIRTEGERDEVHARIWSELAARWPDRFPAAPGSSGNFSSADEFHDQGRAAAGGMSVDSEDADRQELE